jgi:poly(hydroxyalkanoate) granule-associated protein
VTSKFTQVAGQLQKQANGTWDKLESVFEERVARALKRLGVPTSKEIHSLSKRVEELTEAVEKMSGGKVKKAATRAPRSRKSARPAA